ncbi:MAG: hypothetical protein K6T73_01160 [Candidatus Bathyarchaeota archaeon]|nr:hypothetical protein [Candidatus Bathyarchaeota archaeon]
MAKTLLFEGCPTCGELGYSEFPVTETQRDLMMKIVQGGAIGAGGATVLDIVIPKIPVIGKLPATIRPLVNAGMTLLASVMLYKRNPSIAVGIGIGGVAIAAYKFIATMMGKVAVIPPTATAAPSLGMGEIEIESTGGTGVIVPIEQTSGMGSLGYGEDEILVE